jgi:general stress protein 26
MDSSAPDSAFVVWLATIPGSRKVAQLRADGRVALHWTDASGPGYVTLIGSARLVDDPAEKRAHWRASWDPFYPNGADDAVLIEVVPLRVEIISIPDGLDGDPDTWRAEVVEFDAGG